MEIFVALQDLKILKSNNVTFRPKYQYQNIRKLWERIFSLKVDFTNVMSSTKLWLEQLAEKKSDNIDGGFHYHYYHFKKKNDFLFWQAFVKSAVYNIWKRFVVPRKTEQWETFELMVCDMIKKNKWSQYTVIKWH